MNDGAMLTYRLFDGDTNKNVKAVVPQDTAKKSQVVVKKQDTVKTAVPGDTSSKTIAPAVPSEIVNRPETLAPSPQVVTPAVVVPVPQPVAETVMVNDTVQSSDSLQFMHPPYLYHFDDSMQADAVTLFDLDSLMATHSNTVFKKSLFTGHSHTPANDNLIAKHPTTQPSWIFLAFILIAVLLIRILSIFRNNSSRHPDIFRVHNGTSMKMLTRDDIVSPWLSFLIEILYVTLLSMAIFFVATLYDVHITTTPVVDLFILMGAAFVFIYLRILLVRGIGAVFNYKLSIAAYSMNQSLCNLLSSLLLLPALLLAYYSNFSHDVMLYVLAGLVTLMFIVRFVRGSMLMLSESRLSKIYMLYYMFVIEVVPILVIGKWITLQM